ncbi:hypothetical protein KUTeg_017652 [Tegillarca granosa]|uniref:Exonuclease domain-containing protein n=1 Tax=Tegillarca granosa TaxID=220873 RepID=A0ABQ9EFI6_TEGGR|nr:hypothetical protein KUTeg_017652 [Tegillarca granosa]
MSGLDIDKEHILEMACLVTDDQLNVIAESGLTEAVRKSNISLENAEQQMLDFVTKHTVEKQAPLAGNSIHVDRQFLEKYMKKFMNHLHYRIIDVSTAMVSRGFR